MYRKIGISMVAFGLKTGALRNIDIESYLVRLGEIQINIIEERL